METFDNTELLEPLLLYKTQLKDAFHNNAEEYFNKLTEKGNVNIELNQEHCKKYYSEKKIIEALQSKNSGKKTLRGFSIAGIVIFAIAGIVLIALGAMGKFNLALGIGIGVGSLALVGLFIFFVVKLNKIIKGLNEQIAKHEEQAKKHLNDAYETMSGLNNLYEWNMAANLMSKTTPLIQLDPVFDPAKYQYLHDKYKYNEYTDPDISTIYVQSGSILGNPFVFEKNYCQDMRDHRYQGTLVITWTERVSDGKGGSYTVTRTQTLVAYHTAPEPYYYLDTWLIYGCDAAPKLTFSRYPTNLNDMSEKEIAKYIKSFDAKLDKKVKESLTSGKSFTRLHNEEFEALFNALDRDNETEFRLLFTPLAQKNMIALLRGKETGFGDDFIFKKRCELNYIKTGHMQGSDSLNKDPDSFIHFDYKYAKENFLAYADKYLKDVFFDLAPVISIPLYQQHKSFDYIYEKGFNRNVTSAEVESAANSFDINLFKHPATRSLGVILKSHFQKKDNNADICTISAHSFEGIDRIEYVPTMGGDGRLHNVPVHWVEYRPIVKETPFVVEDTKAASKSEYQSSYNEGKFNDVINKFGNSSAIQFKKRLMSFIPKK